MNNVILHIADKEYIIRSQKGTIEIDGRVHEIDIRKVTENEYSVLIDGRSHHFFFTKGNDSSYAQIDNQIVDIRKKSLRDELSVKFLKRQIGTHSAVIFHAPMPGMVTKILVPVNTNVEIGEGIVVVEAMKMENEIKTTKPGIVTKIFVKEKQAVEKGDQLFVIE
ncbi:MAG: hypothetical protein PHP42_11900 [Bacteroidota bacterium]|nr:hypothetical protein [Bacteroidota bacterium]